MDTCQTEVEELRNGTGCMCWTDALQACGRSISRQWPVWSEGQEVCRACSSSLRMSLPALVSKNRCFHTALGVEVHAGWHPVAGVASGRQE
jgi:hypothetical protein